MALVLMVDNRLDSLQRLKESMTGSVAQYNILSVLIVL